MRPNVLAVALVSGLGVAGVSFLSCGGDDASTPPPADASADGTDAADAAAPDTDILPPDDASKRSCKLDNGTDPVELCTQKLVLKALHEAAFVEATGVLAGWDQATALPDTDDAGKKLHDVHDDAAYGAAINAYGLSATRYGDTELTPTLDQDLLKLVPVLKKELATLPDEYAGELYANLRGVAVGLRYLNQNDDANAIDQQAEIVARGIYAHFVPLGAGDGVLAASGPNRDYAPADVATGALALLDMAVRHAQDDGGAEAAGWVSAAQASLDHIYARGREPATKMYYRLLVPSAAAGHDDLSPRAPSPPDALTTDAAGTIALALMHAQELVDKNAAALAKVAAYPFAAHAAEAIASVNGTPSLYDAASDGYMEAYVPSTSTVLTNKPTRSNALLFAAIHHANIAVLSPYAAQLKPLRAVMVSQTKSNASLLSASGLQNAYFRLVTKDFATLGADSGLPFPKSYASAAVTIACAGLTEQIYGVP